MSQSLLGRLPPLQAIGRSKCIDLDDPPVPQEEEDAVDLVDSYLQSLEKESESTSVYRFEAEHAVATSSALATGFKVLRPGSHHCKKLGEQVTGFVHCQKGVSFALKHQELDRLLETRARLEFMKDLLSRLNTFGAFVSELQQSVKEESETWHNISQNSLTNMPTTKLEQLCALCEDLRMQLNQWNSIKQSMHTSRHLQPLLPSLCSNIAIVQHRLRSLSESAIFWLGRLILVGFKVLAHCDLERIGQEALWNIARGLEEYNMLVSAAQTTHPRSPFDDLGSTHLRTVSADSPTIPSHHLCDSLGRYNAVVPLSKALKLFAYERAKYAAASAKVYFTGSKDFLMLIKNTRLPLYTWYPDVSVGESTERVGLRQSPDKVTSLNAFGSSPNSSNSPSTSLHVTGDVFAPDLSSEISPLIDFARRENTFIGHFLQIVCHSTCLIEKQSHKSAAADCVSSQAVDRRPRMLRPKLITFGTTQVANVNAGFDPGDREGDSGSRKGTTDSEIVKVDATRKNVSWSDSSLAVSIQQVSQDYAQKLWSNFAEHIYNFWVSTEWGQQKEVKDHLGSVILCSDTVTMVIKHMVQQASLGDTFPLGSRSSLASIALRLHASVAWAAWDSALNASLASAAVDKCQPLALSTDDAYSTATGKLLRDTYQPLHSLLSTLAGVTAATSHDDGAISAVAWTDGATVSVLLSVLNRLTVTADLSYSWCNEKTFQLTASRNVSSLLLVAFNDLQILAEENDRAFRIFQQLYDKLMASSSSPSDKWSVWQVEESWKMANESHCLLQALVSSSQKQFHQLCLSSSRDFFHNEMPAGKDWKRKASEVLPIQHLEYIERAMDSLLEPVVNGVSRIRPAAQFDALATAVADVCDAWTSNILNKKIRFSYHGACQLELDVLYLKTWLASYISDTQLCHHLTSLDFIQYLDCIVMLLKQQPTGHHGRRSGSRVRQQPIGNAEKGFKASCPDGTQSLSNTSTCTPSSDTTEDNKNGGMWDSSKMAAVDRSSRSYTAIGNSASLEDGESEGRMIPHREQWLALRVHGGTRNWPKLSSCFNNLSV